MFWAFGRLILIAVSAVLWIVLAVFALRSVGEKQKYSEFSHPLLDNERWLIAEGGDLDSGPDQSLPALRTASELNKNIFLGIKIRITLDGHWVLYAPRRLEELSTGSGYVAQKNLSEITSLKFKASPNEPLLALASVFKEFPHARYYIDVLQPGATQLNILYKLIKEYRLEKRVILTSAFMDTLVGLRNENSQWLTGAATSEASKSEFMTSIYLETMMGLNYDVFVAKKPAPRLITELERRKKIVIFALDDHPDLLSAAQLHPAAGILTKRPSHFLQLVDSEALSH